MVVISYNVCLSLVPVWGLFLDRCGYRLYQLRLVRHILGANLMSISYQCGKWARTHGELLTGFHSILSFCVITKDSFTYIRVVLVLCWLGLCGDQFGIIMGSVRNNLNDKCGFIFWAGCDRFGIHLVSILGSNLKWTYIKIILLLMCSCFPWIDSMELLQSTATTLQIIWENPLPHLEHTAFKTKSRQY